jgi:hypothetical protein
MRKEGIREQNVPDGQLLFGWHRPMTRNANRKNQNLANREKIDF